MLRVVLIQLALFATPFVVWAFYVVVMKRKQLSSGGVFRDAPIAGLVLAGTALVAVALIYMAVFTGDPAGEGTYVPPRFEDGQIIPGRVE
ncbi:DUF6111 family protein [Pyruvatibacter sp.]|uniref:DUF6111 family protein n=1 Tax=Pyruvatibacter sp. TaxID=1981328 RepID=UPI0032EA9807